MIAKPEWFSRRKYTGWGLTPTTWQGWAYIVVMVAPLVVVMQGSSIGTAKMAFLIVWAVIFGADFIDMMIRIPKDERDRLHEAISERNALWVMVIVLAAGVGYQVATSVAANGSMSVDPVILAALLAGTIAKAVSNLYLDRKD